MNAKEQDDFYNKHGAGVHTDPVRFQATADLCLGRVLDIACGTGDLADYYDGEYVGIDQSEVAIHMAKEVPRTNVTFLIQDAFDLINVDAFNYDTVVMAEFLEHIKTWDSYCQQIIFKMKGSGRLIISVPNGNRVPDKDHVVEFTVPKLRHFFKQYGRVQFHNYDGFSSRILMTVDLGEKNKNLISLGMFCKNEGQGLETAILSAINFVDEIVILVDDSSNDNTLEIAKLYGDIGQTFKWKDSFCKARELVQKFVTRPWVLILDGHEFVTQSLALYQMLEFEGDGLMTKVRLENGFTFDFPRIIRRDVEWEFDVHNNAKVKEAKMYSGFIIQHDRENLQSKEACEIRADQRTKMIQEKMFADIKKDKTDKRPYFYLGELYFSLKKYKKAQKFWKKYIKYSDNKQERWLVYYQIAGCYSQRGFYPLVFKWLKKAEKEMPRRWEIQKAMGINYLLLLDYESAVKHLTLSLSGPKEKAIYSPLPFDLFDTWEKISTCYRRLDKPHEAILALKQALKKSDSSVNIKNIKQRIKIIKEFTDI